MTKAQSPAVVSKELQDMFPEAKISVVSEVPASVTIGKTSMWDAVIEAAKKDPAKALAITVADANEAGQKAQGLRGLLKRRHMDNDFTVAKQGEVIYVQYTPETE